MITTTAGGRAWHYSHSLGRLTPEHNESRFGRTGGFVCPMDVATAGDDILFVVSRGDGGITTGGFGTDIYMRIGKTTIDEDHLGDFARGGFTWPVGIAVSNSGDVYCSDEYECNISAFRPDSVRTFPEYDPEGEYFSRWGTKGPKEGQLNGPTGIAFDTNDDLHVSDSLNHRIQIFSKNGDFIGTWGSYGASEGQLNRPWGITIDQTGAVYVADWGNHRVQKFSSTGEYLMTFGTQDSTASSLEHPAGVAVDSEGDVYVTDCGNRRVQIFEPDGTILTALYADVNELNKAVQYNLERDPENAKLFRQQDDYLMGNLRTFGRPIGIDIDDQNRIIITDSRGRLIVYQKDVNYQEPST